MVYNVGNVVVEAPVGLYEKLSKALHPRRRPFPHILKVEDGQSSQTPALHAIFSQSCFRIGLQSVGVSIEYVAVVAVGCFLRMMYSDIIPVDKVGLADDDRLTMHPITPKQSIAFLETQVRFYIYQPGQCGRLVNDVLNTPVVIAFKYDQVAIGILVTCRVLYLVEYGVAGDVLAQESLSLRFTSIIGRPS